MAIDPQEFARLLGAKIAGEVPDVGGGPFGMARLARVMHQTLTPSQGERPGRPTNPNWTTRCKVPMSAATLEKLTQLAENVSAPKRKVSPMQVAAQLLEEAVSQVGERLSDISLEVILDNSDAPASEAVRVNAAGGGKGGDAVAAMGPGQKSRVRDTKHPTENRVEPEEPGRRPDVPSKETNRTPPRKAKGQPQGGKFGGRRKKA